MSYGLKNEIIDSELQKQIGALRFSFESHSWNPLLLKETKLTQEIVQFRSLKTR